MIDYAQYNHMHASNLILGNTKIDHDIGSQSEHTTVDKTVFFLCVPKN